MDLSIRLSFMLLTQQPIRLFTRTGALWLRAYLLFTAFLVQASCFVSVPRCRIYVVT